MLLEISGEITPEKNEEMEPKQKQHPVVDVTGGMGWRWPAAGLGALSVAVHAWDLLKEVPITFTTSTRVWPQVNSREGAQLHHQQKTGLKTSWAWPRPSEQDPFSPSVSPSRKLPYASYSSPSEGRQNENHNHRKVTDLITWTTALSNSIKLWAIPCRATQDGRVTVESSDKMWSTGEGNGKPPQYSCLENPMNRMKRLFSICSVSRLNIYLSLDNLQMMTEKKEFVNIFKTPDQEGDIGDSWIFLLPWMHCWMYSYKQSNSFERN